jgi:hypothetical protein
MTRIESPFGKPGSQRAIESCNPIFFSSMRRIARTVVMGLVTDAMLKRVSRVTATPSSTSALPNERSISTRPFRRRRSWPERSPRATRGAQ